MSRKDNIPTFVVENLAAMKKLRLDIRLSRFKLASATGIPLSSLLDYEQSYRIPSPSRYNLLAAFFHWRTWD